MSLPDYDATIEIKYKNIKIQEFNVKNGKKVSTNNTNNLKNFMWTN